MSGGAFELTHQTLLVVTGKSTSRRLSTSSKLLEPTATLLGPQPEVDLSSDFLVFESELSR